MKKIILICLFGLMFSDSITYVKDYGILGKSVSPEVVEGVKILEVNEYSLEYQDESGSVKTLSLDLVLDIKYDDGRNFEFKNKDSKSIDNMVKNSGYYLNQAGENFFSSVVLSGLGWVCIYYNYPQIAGASFLCSFLYQLTAYSNITKSGEILQKEINELQQDNNE